MINKIQHIILLTISVFIHGTASGQSSKELIKKSTHYFSITKNDLIEGDGGSLIQQKISESQFFLIGEQHNISQIETFVQILIPTLKQNGFNNYITEIGPIAATELEQLPKHKTALKDFNTKYSKYVKAAPLGFFGTEEEGQTLQKLNKFNINLLGVDFENYCSYLFLIDKIYQNANKEKVSFQQYEMVRNAIIYEYANGKNGYNPNLTKNLLNSKLLSAFLEESNSAYNKALIQDLLKSLYINNEQKKGHWWLRVDNMKSNFTETYKNLQKNKELHPKIFFKFGAVHMSRGASFSGFQELGNTIYELSKLNQTKSFIMTAFPRYIYDEKTGVVEDAIEEEDSEILQFTTSDKWTIIDLKELFKLSIDNHISLDKNIIGYIERYDAILIPPATKYSEKNY